MHNAHVIDFLHWRYIIAHRLGHFWRQALLADWHLQELRAAEREMRQ